MLKFKNDVTIIKKDNMKYIDFTFVFPIGKIEDDDIFNFSILKSLISSYSLKYPEEDLFIDAKEENTVYNYSFGTKTVGETTYGLFGFLIPEKGLIDDFDLDKAFEFVYESLFNSVCIDVESITDKMYFKEFYKIKENIERSCGTFNKFCSNEWIKVIDGTGKYYLTDMDLLEILGTKTSKERIVELYKKYILDNDYFTVITGNVRNENELLDSFNKVFKKEEKEIEFETIYEPTYPCNYRGETIVESSFNQTFLKMQFVNKDFTYKDKYILMMIRCFLSNKENDLLFNILRLKYNLVYYCSSSVDKVFGSINLSASLNEENIDKAKNAMNEVIDILKDEDYFNEAKKQLLKADKINLYSALDSKTKDTDDFINDRLNIDSYEKENKELASITFDEFKNFVDKLEVKNTLIIKGGQND